jgi:hypothetical protein
MIRLERPREAVTVLERALEIRRDIDPDSARLAETEFALGAALWQERPTNARALELARRALARVRATPGTEAQRSEIAHWLSKHDATFAVADRQRDRESVAARPSPSP